MIEFQGKFDDNVTKNLNNHTFKKLWWMFVLFSAIFIFLGVIGILFREDNEDLTYGIFMIVFGLLFTPLVFLITKFMQKKLNKSMHVLSSNTIETYQFYPDKLVIIQRKWDEYESITNANYSYLYKVEETRDCYFLRISKMQSHVVNKADITQGTIEELNEIFSANLGERFKAFK